MALLVLVTAFETTLTVSMYTEDPSEANPAPEFSELLRLLTPRLTKYIPWQPTETQAAFLLLDCGEALYGGAAGGGKSVALLMAALQYVDVPGYNALLLRRTFAALSKHLPNEHLVDLIMTVAFYNGVVRVLGSLQIDVEPDYQSYLARYPLPPKSA